jgi:hypothetical protein
MLFSFNSSILIKRVIMTLEVQINSWALKVNSFEFWNLSLHNIQHNIRNKFLYYFAVARSERMREKNECFFITSKRDRRAGFNWNFNPTNWSRSVNIPSSLRLSLFTALASQKVQKRRAEKRQTNVKLCNRNK